MVSDIKSHKNALQQENAHGVVALLEKLIADVEKDTPKVQTAEKNSHGTVRGIAQISQGDHGTQ